MHDSLGSEGIILRRNTCMPVIKFIINYLARNHDFRHLLKTIIIQALELVNRELVFV